MYEPLKLAICILGSSCLLMMIVVMLSKSKPHDQEEGEKYPFDEHDIYKPSKNGTHHKKAS